MDREAVILSLFFPVRFLKTPAVKVGVFSLCGIRVEFIEILFERIPYFSPEPDVVLFRGTIPYCNSPGAEDKYAKVFTVAMSFNISIERIIHRNYSTSSHAYKYQAPGLNPPKLLNGLVSPEVLP